MAETTTCPQCTRKLLVPEGVLGNVVQCPTCGTTFTAEATAPPAEPPPPPRLIAEEKSPRLEEEAPPRPAERSLRRRDAGDGREYRGGPRRGGARRDCEPHRGGLILVLGILSLVVCQVFGPFAWVMGSQDLAAMRAGRMDPEGQGMTEAGRVCGMIGTILLLLSLVLVLIGVLVGILGTLADNSP